MEKFCNLSKNKSVKKYICGIVMIAISLICFLLTIALLGKAINGGAPAYTFAFSFAWIILIIIGLVLMIPYAKEKHKEKKYKKREKIKKIENFHYGHLVPMIFMCILGLLLAILGLAIQRILPEISFLGKWGLIIGGIFMMLISIIFILGTIVIKKNEERQTNAKSRENEEV